mmetsp:Transcript_28001/g.83013  ORF Transcript_28001/g.83013 Transcript_28001/m.83013 type:complete len:129 (-) Transcript_28001:263-649(-)
MAGEFPELWPRKVCRTCGFDRPPRSKHCSMCGFCVARHDHHCAWINNCVGIGNQRAFMAFLLINIAMTLYGSLLGIAVLGGELSRHGVLRRKYMDWTVGEARTMSSSPKRLLQWLLLRRCLSRGRRQQ